MRYWRFIQLDIQIMIGICIRLRLFKLHESCSNIEKRDTFGSSSLKRLKIISDFIHDKVKDRIILYISNELQAADLLLGRVYGDIGLVGQQPAANQRRVVWVRRKVRRVRQRDARVLNQVEWNCGGFCVH